MKPETIAAADAAGAPSFLVGRDQDGHWLAVETRGHGGRLFVSRDAAWHYAWSEAGRRPGAVSAAPEPLAFARAAFNQAPASRLSIPAKKA